MKSHGWTIRHLDKTKIVAYYGNSSLTWESGKGLRVTGYDTDATIKRVTKDYSVEAVSWAAKRAGWQVQQTASDKLTVTRR